MCKEWAKGSSSRKDQSATARARGAGKNKRCLLQRSSSEKRKKWDHFSSGYLLWIINISFSMWLINTYPSGSCRSISSVQPFLSPSDRTGNCLHRPPPPAITWQAAVATIAINLFTALRMYVTTQRGKYSIIPIYRWGNWGSERLSNFAEANFLC